jgi:hypothetical protein
MRFAFAARAWLGGAVQLRPHRAPREGYFAAAAADADLEAKPAGASVSIVTPPRPVFYDRNSEWERPDRTRMIGPGASSASNWRIRQW